MARQQLTKVLLHASAEVDKKVHRWVVAAFANEADAKVFAGMIKMAHATKSSAAIFSVDASTPKDDKGNAVTPVKLYVQEVPYAPHTRVGDGLDEGPITPAAPPAK